jgi:hypothetical protein
MKYAILRTDDGRHFGKILDEEGNVVFETSAYKAAESVRQHLRRWIRMQQRGAPDPEPRT